MGERQTPREIMVAEQYADGELDPAQVDRIRSRLMAQLQDTWAWAAREALRSLLDTSAEVAARETLSAALNFRYPFASEGLRGTDEYQAKSEVQRERTVFVSLAHDIFDNPF